MAGTGPGPRRRSVLAGGVALLVGAGVTGVTGCSERVPRSGLNAAGADFGVGARFDSDASFAFYASRGHRLVRLPFLWESVQPRPGGPLDAAYVERLLAAVGSCTSRSMTCVLDVHSYGRHGEAVLGDGRLHAGHLADLWRRLAGLVLDDDLVQLGLMNEPHDLPGGPPAWEEAAQAAVDAVRAAGSRHWLWVAGEQWSSAASWSSTHPRWWVRDPLRRSGPEGHYYFDAANQHRGTYPGRYADDEAAAVADGYRDLTDKVESELGSFVHHCRDQGVTGLLGEIGWPNGGPASAHPADAAAWADLGRRAYEVLLEGGVGVAYWAAGEQWGEGYDLSLYTGTPQSRPTAVAAVVEPA